MPAVPLAATDVAVRSCFRAFHLPRMEARAGGPFYGVATSFLPVSTPFPHASRRVLHIISNSLLVATTGETNHRPAHRLSATTWLMPLSSPKGCGQMEPIPGDIWMVWDMEVMRAR